MCAIFGFLRSTPRAPQETSAILERMGEAMRHRGPDDAGAFLGDGMALGHRRLSIIDPTCGHQPLGNEDGTIQVVANGEIYNFQALRQELAVQGHRFATQSDSEVIAHAYEAYGDDCVLRFEGMFAFALWDGRRRRLLLARDRMGEKPLHYTLANGEFVFASELKGLLRHPAVGKSLNLQALSAYLLCEYVPAPLTIYEGIHKLPPAHRLTLEAGALRVEPYWELPLFEPKPRIGEAEAAERCRELLEAAVRKQLISDVPLGAFLSGGIDSGSVVALMARLRPAGGVKTFTISFDEPSFDESRHARRVADALGTEHQEHRFAMPELLALLPETVGFLDEPFADPSVLPTYLLARFTRQHVTVALSGDGGDELFAGYPTFQAFALSRPYLALPRPARRLLAACAQQWPVSHRNLSFDFKLKQFLKGVEAPAERRHAAWLGAFMPAEQTQLLTTPTSNRLNGYDAFEAVPRRAAPPGVQMEDVLLDQYARGYLAEDILVKVDRATMACSLESRAPFLDHHLVEFVSRLPYDLKLRGLTTKYLLKRASGAWLPSAIRHRPKKGFGMPIGPWLRGELRDWARGLLEPTKLRREGLFDPEETTRLLDDHLAGRRDYRKPLWTLLMFEAWYDRHFLGTA